jgi:MFS family permease
MRGDEKTGEAVEVTPMPESYVMAEEKPTSPKDAIPLADTHRHSDPAAGEEPPQDSEMQQTTTNTSIASTKPPMPLGQEIMFVAVVCCAQLFTQASLGQAIPILQYIGPTFGGLNAGQLSWIAAAFSLTTGTFIIIAGRVGDMVGHKAVFIFGWGWCSLWALLAGLSALTREQIFFDVCRAMQGIGSAMLVPSALALLGSTYRAGRRKAMVFSIFGATAPNGFLIGALFAGITAEFAWWPWAFWLMAICCAALAALSFPVIPSASETGSSIGPQSFDYIGAVTGVTGLVLFNVAWNQAPTAGWQTPYVIALLILGFVFLIVFFVVERRVKQPLLPMSGFSSEVGFVLGCIALGWSSFGIWLYYLWGFLENLRGETPLLAVAHLYPAALAGIVAALLTGKLLSILRPEIIMLVALCAFFVGNVFVATMGIDQTYWAETFLTSIITPFGMDMSFPAATLILSNSVPKRHQGIAASLVVTVVNYSISIGLGIGGIVQSQIDSNGQATLLGYRGAMHAAIGLAGCGILLAVVFVVYSSVSRRRIARKEVSSDETAD